MKAHKRTVAVQWRADNPDRAREGQADWYIRNAETKKASAAAYRAANKERLAAQRKAKRQANLEVERAADRERYLIRRRKDAELMREQGRRRSASRRARERKVQVLPFSAAQWAEKSRYWGHRCWICREQPGIEMDHVKPVTAGGAHMLCNLRPICRTCNAAKAGLWPFDVKTFAGPVEISPQNPVLPAALGANPH